MKEDVAGATFMAAASSSPELFINSVGTFITEGDLGVGTVVGSSVFNILAVPACCGLFAGRVSINLDRFSYLCLLKIILTYLHSYLAELIMFKLLIIGLSFTIILIKSGQFWIESKIFILALYHAFVYLHHICVR